MLYFGDVKSHTILEYIQSTGTQYINTNYVFNNNCRLVLVGAEFSGTCMMHGSNVYGSDGITISVDAGNLYWSYNKDVQLTSDLVSKHTIDGYQNVVKLDGETISSDGEVNTHITFTSIRLFCDGSASRFGSYKLYSFQIYDSDVLVRDFIPVRRFNNEVCLYDKIENKYYYNSGSGVFTAGPEIEEV